MIKFPSVRRGRKAGGKVYFRPRLDDENVH